MSLDCSYNLLNSLISQKDIFGYFLRSLAIDELLVLSGLNCQYRNVLLSHPIWQEKWIYFYPDEESAGEGKSRLHLIHLTLDYEHRKEVTEYFCKKNSFKAKYLSKKEFRKAIIVIKWGLKEQFRKMIDGRENRVELEELYLISAFADRVEFMKMINERYEWYYNIYIERIFPVRATRYLVEQTKWKDLSEILEMNIKSGYFETLTYLLRYVKPTGQVYRIFIAIIRNDKLGYVGNLIDLCEHEDLDEDSFIQLKAAGYGYVVELPDLMLLAIDCLTEPFYRKFTKLYQKMDCPNDDLLVRAHFRNPTYAEWLLRHHHFKISKLGKRLTKRQLTQSKRI